MVASYVCMYVIEPHRQGVVIYLSTVVWDTSQEKDN